MRITCDKRHSMGYIYLYDPGYHKYTDSESIRELIKTDKCEIPRYSGLDIEMITKEIKISEKTYLDAIEFEEVIEEYINDKDEQGYLKGIELNLKSDTFIKLIKEKAFADYDTVWFGKKSFLFKFNTERIVFNPNNVIYPLNDLKDTFVICSPTNMYGANNILGLISSRFDIYDTNYFMTADFILS